MSASGLKRFIEERKVPLEAAAKALGVSRTALYYWLTERTTPSEPAKDDIEKWTDGAVPAAGWPSHERRKNPPKDIEPLADEVEDEETKGSPKASPEPESKAAP